jgi:NADH dehydrogenase
VYFSPRLTLWAGDLVGAYVHDVLLTRQELQGMMEELLVSAEKPRGARRIDNWLLGTSDSIGRNYASELDRHWRGVHAPATLPAASRPEAPPG